MAESIKGFYNRRHPERTDYYRIIEGSFEEFDLISDFRFKIADLNKGFEVFNLQSEIFNLQLRGAILNFSRRSTGI